MSASGHLADLARSWALPATRRPAPATPEKVLVLGYAAIGDFIFFLPVLEALRAAWPSARLTFLANPSPVTRELLPAAGLVDEIWLCDWEGPGAARERRAINRRIRDAAFDAAVLTLSSPAHYFQEGVASIPIRAGHLRPRPEGSFRARLKRSLVTGEYARRAWLNRAARIGAESEPAVARNARLLGALGLPVPSPLPRPRLPISGDDRAWAAEQLRGLDPAKRRVGLHLGPPRNQYHKIWDPERFGRLCARLSREWPVEFVVVGDAGDAESLQAARRQAPLPHSWVGAASLTRTFALIERCDLFLSNDTGPAKAAGALGVPTATLMGLSDPVEVGIPWERDKHIDIRTGIACSPCASLGMAREGRLNYLNCGHHACMTDMDVGFVLAALRRKYDASFLAARA